MHVRGADHGAGCSRHRAGWGHDLGAHPSLWAPSRCVTDRGLGSIWWRLEDPQMPHLVTCGSAGLVVQAAGLPGDDARHMRLHGDGDQSRERPEQGSHGSSEESTFPPQDPRAGGRNEGGSSVPAPPAWSPGTTAALRALRGPEGWPVTRRMDRAQTSRARRVGGVCLAGSPSERPAEVGRQPWA